LTRARQIANFDPALFATDVPVAHGGTGASTHTANNVLIGAGTSAITSIAPGADGQVLTSTGSVWQSEAAAGGGGKVLQVKSIFDHAGQSFDTDIDTILTVQLTNVLSDSTCIAFWHLVIKLTNETGNAGFEAYIYRDSTNLTAGEGSDPSGPVSWCSSGESPGYFNWPLSGQVEDDAPTTGTVNYYLKGSRFADTPIISAGGVSSLTVMEIAA